MTRTLDQATIERINQHLMRTRRGDALGAWFNLIFYLPPCLFGIYLLDGPLFAKVILGGFICFLAVAWCLVKRTNNQQRPASDVSGIEVQQLEGYFDRQRVRTSTGLDYKYSFGTYTLHLLTLPGSFFSGDDQLKLNRRYRVDALYLTEPVAHESGYYLLRETFQEITDDSDLSAEQKAQVAERETRINQQLEAQYKRLYRIYQNPQGELEAIGEGFNFAAFFLGVLWSFSARVDRATWIALAALGLALFAAWADDNYHWLTLCLFIIAAVFGACGNLWREKQARDKGFVEVDSVLSCNPDQAKVAYKRKIEEAQWHVTDLTPEGSPQKPEACTQ